jgi:hypothetical protein
VDSTAVIWTVRSRLNPSRTAWARIAPLISTVRAITSRTTNAIRRCSGVASVLARRAWAVSLPA